MNLKKNWMFIAPAAIAGIIVIAFIGGEIVKLLWNWLMPQLFGWREITFWQGFGLLALCRILFGGLGAHGAGGSRSGMRTRVLDRVADRVGDRWDDMTPEERERFRQRLRERCGFDPATAETRDQAPKPE